MSRIHGPRSTSATLTANNVEIWASRLRDRSDNLNLSIDYLDGRKQEITMRYIPPEAIEYFKKLVGPLNYPLRFDGLSEQFEFTGPWTMLLRGDTSLAKYRSNQEPKTARAEQTEVSLPGIGAEFSVIFNDFRAPEALSPEALRARVEKERYIFDSVFSRSRQFRLQKFTVSPLRKGILIGSFIPQDAKPGYREWANLLLIATSSSLATDQVQSDQIVY
jgi:hypothetical protein